MHSDSANEIFQQLREQLLEYAEGLTCTADNKQEYSLYTHHIMKNKKALFFAAAIIRKHYVSFHLMPVYVTPELLEGVSPELRRRMQGKSCFNFRRADEALFEQLTALTRSGYDSYVEQGYILPPARA